MVCFPVFISASQYDVATLRKLGNYIFEEMHLFCSKENIYFIEYLKVIKS